MVDYQKEKMLHNGVELPVDIVITLAENACSQSEVNSYLLSLLWYAGEHNDKELRRICNNIRVMKGGISFSPYPASLNNLPPKEHPVDKPHNDVVLNYFQPQRNLNEMLQGKWFADVCTDKNKYNTEWAETFVLALMRSEFKDEIAIEWGKRGKLDKRDYIRGCVIGLLKEAGVLKGSNLAIARAYLGVGEKTRDEELKRKVSTFANYIGKGRKEPYADWIIEYINKMPDKS